MRRNLTSGQSTLLALLAMSLVLIGAMGFGIDTATMYGHFQLAQAAADGAAQAEAMSILVGTATFSSATTFTCTNGSDTRSACEYARQDGFGTTGSADTVTVDILTSVPNVTLSPDFPNSGGIHVTVVRPIPTTLMGLISAKSTNIKAAATAALVQANSPIPILILHPTLSGSFSMGGNPLVKICGGPQRSIMVNSSSTTGFSPPSGAALIDISKGGPADTNGDCSTPGNGTDLGSYGGPPVASLPSCSGGKGICFGAVGKYVQPATPISDPLENVAPPSSTKKASLPTCNPQTNCSTPLANGVSGCPVSPGKPCALYTPGYYPNGMNAKNETAVFSPGVYYIDGGGFGNAANGDSYMCTTCAADTSSEGTGNTGMLVYVSPTGGTLSVGANGVANLSGSSFSSNYQGMLFFVDRTQTGTPVQKLGGGGTISLVGTIYARTTGETASLYQTVNLQGGSCSSTAIKGEIITDVLSMGGTGCINMQLDPNFVLPINQVALVK